jgi:hypothetical protein
MTDRELIYNTLLSGIPYGIVGSVTCYDEETNMPVEVVGQIKGLRNNGYVEFYYPDDSFSLFRINEVKPYLRQMSSMTMEEKKTVCAMNALSETELDDRIKYHKMYISSYTIETFDLFNSNHLDYRDLIIMGLAIEAPEGMY